MSLAANPDFIHIGPTKTGTTWLQENLSKHPDVWLAPVKEINFFWGMGRKLDPPPIYSTRRLSVRNLKNVVKIALRHFFGNPRFRWRRKYSERRWQYYIEGKSFSVKELLWDFKYICGLQSSRWYFSLFPNKNGLITGDISPLYYRYSEDEIKKLAKARPDLKVIISLRDPIDRIWSSAKMVYLKNQGKELHEVSSRQFRSSFNWSFMGCPGYLPFIQKWREHFPKENIKIVYFETLRQDAAQYLSEIMQFLGLDPSRYEFDKVVLSKKVHEGLEVSIPRHLEEYLAYLLEPSTREWYEYSKSDHARKWLDHCEQVIDGAHKKSPPYQRAF